MYVHWPAKCMYTGQPNVCKLASQMYVHWPAKCMYTGQPNVCKLASQMYVHWPAKYDISDLVGIKKTYIFALFVYIYLLMDAWYGNVRLGC